MEAIISEEEVRAFNLVLDIVGEKVCRERISRSQAKTYLAVVLDNNPHRTICRIYLNGPRKQLGTICERKVETRVPIDDVEDIRKFSNALIKRVQAYDSW